MLLLPLSSLAALGETLTPVANPVLLDATGKYMGHLGGGSFGSLLFKLSNNDHVVLYLSPVPSSGLTWQQNDLFYQSGDCTGQAYGLNAGVGERNASIGPNHVLYVSAPGASPSSINFSSYRSADNICNLYSGSPSPLVLAVDPVVSLDTLFQGPFKAADVAQQSAPALSPAVLVALAALLCVVGVVIMRRGIFAG